MAVTFSTPEQKFLEFLARQISLQSNNAVNALPINKNYTFHRIIPITKFRFMTFSMLFDNEITFLIWQSRRLIGVNRYKNVNTHNGLTLFYFQIKNMETVSRDTYHGRCIIVS